MLTLLYSIFLPPLKKHWFIINAGIDRDRIFHSRLKSTCERQNDWNNLFTNTNKSNFSCFSDSHRLQLFIIDGQLQMCTNSVSKQQQLRSETNDSSLCSQLTILFPVATGGKVTFLDLLPFYITLSLIVGWQPFNNIATSGIKVSVPSHFKDSITITDSAYIDCIVCEEYVKNFINLNSLFNPFKQPFEYTLNLTRITGDDDRRRRRKTSRVFCWDCDFLITSFIPRGDIEAQLYVWCYLESSPIAFGKAILRNYSMALLSS